MELPQFLSSQEKLKNLAGNIYCLDHPDDSFEWDLKWEYANSKELVEETWLEQKTNEDIIPTNFTISVGSIYVNRHILHLVFFRKYWSWGNNPEIRNAYLAFTDELAKIFNQNLVIFYPDSMVKQSNIEDLADTIGETIKIADQMFGKPTGIIEDDIKNYYFIQRLG
jgi:hypothetical protein